MKSSFIRSTASPVSLTPQVPSTIAIPRSTIPTITSQGLKSLVVPGAEYDQPLSFQGTEGQIVPLPLEDFLAYTSSFRDPTGLNCDLSPQLTLNSSNRPPSRFSAYLSPQTSRIESPSMDSDGMIDGYEFQDSHVSGGWSQIHSDEVDGRLTPTSSCEAQFANLTYPHGSFAMPGFKTTGPHYNSSQLQYYETNDLRGDIGRWVDEQDPDVNQSQQVEIIYPHFVANGIPSHTNQPFIDEMRHLQNPIDLKLQAHNIPTQRSAFAGVSEADGAKRSMTTCISPLPKLAEPLSTQGLVQLPQADVEHYTCRSCCRPFRDQLTWEQHQADCESLECLFAFAGCKARCKGKNEWKRHIKTQHLLTRLYACPECDNKKEFNRKDLFTQHYLRMHASAKEYQDRKDKKYSSTFEKRLVEMQNAADRGEQLAPPAVEKCFVLGCNTTFPDAADSWEKCLEHASKHHKAASRGEEPLVQYEFTLEQLRYFETVKAIKRSSVQYSDRVWVLGEQSNGKRARENKKKISKRQCESEDSSLRRIRQCRD